MEAGSRMVSCWGALLRTRIHSVLLKKNNLFLIAGPPSENPKLLRVNPPLGVPVASFWKVLADRAATRLNSYALPLKALPPDFVTRLTRRRWHDRTRK